MADDACSDDEDPFSLHDTYDYMNGTSMAYNNNQNTSSEHFDDFCGLSHSRWLTVEDTWVECTENDSGRTIWYNRETMLISFENPFKQNFKPYILQENITGDDINDNDIPNAILRFNIHSWNFRNDYCDVFRAQASNIDHTLLLPQAADLSFPEFFSNHTIPKKESFLATILPPIGFPTCSLSWKMNIKIATTTAADIITKFANKVFRFCIVFIYIFISFLIVSHFLNFYFVFFCIFL